MGSLISLLVLGAIYSIVYVVKRLSPPQDGGKQVFGEAFPEIEMPEPQPEYVARAREAAPERHPSKPERKRRGASQPQPVRPVVADDEAFDKNDGKQTAGKPLVHLGNKSEAKKAFIYSEIFKRKY